MSSIAASALGENALSNNTQEQLEHAKTAAAISDIVSIGYKVVIANGKGPQVGMIKKHLDMEIRLFH